MDEKNPPKADQPRADKIFFIVFFLLIICSIGATYYRTMIKKDYIISAQIDCDPYTEKCFVWECDPISTVEGEACTGDPEMDIWYYKIFQRKAYNVPLCDPNDESCDAFVCAEGEEDCGETLCSPEAATEGEICNDPEEYALNNPPEEDEEECEGDDCEVAEGDEESEDAEEIECDSSTEDCITIDVEETDEANEESEIGEEIETE